MHRSFAPLLALVLVAASLPAQELRPARSPRLDIRMQVGFLPLGDVSTWLPSVGVGYWLPLGNRRTMLEASFGHVGQDRNDLAPALTFFGLLAHGALREPTAPGAQPFLLLGIGRLRLDDVEVTCEWPCFEGGSPFSDGTFTTGVGGGGVLVPVSARAALRGDLRLYLPLDAVPGDGMSGDLRREFAAGIVFRL